MENGSMENGKLIKYKKLKIVLFVLLGLVLLIFLLIMIYHNSLNNAVTNNLKKLKDDGYPVTLTELDKFYPQVPDDDNAALVYLKAFKFYKPPEQFAKIAFISGNDETPKLGENLPEDIYQNTLHYLEANSQCIELCRKAELLNRSRYPVDFTGGMINIELPHLRKIRNTVELLQTAAWFKILCIQYGKTVPFENYESVIKDITTALKLTSSLSEEPITISTLVMSACYHETMRVVMKLIETHELSEEQLLRLDKELSNPKLQFSLKRDLIGEQTLDIDLIKSDTPLLELITMYNALGGGKKMTFTPADKTLMSFKNFLYSISGYRKKDLIYFTENFPNLIKLPEGSYPEIKDKLQALENKVNSDKQKTPPPILSGMLMPVQFIMFNTYYAHRAYVNIFRTVLHIELSRIKHGTLPEKLSEIDFKEKSDPFTGRELHYRQSKTGGYTISSAGPDARFNSKDDIIVYYGNITNEK